MKKPKANKTIHFFRYTYIVNGSSYSRLYKLLKDNKLNAGDIQEKDGSVSLSVPYYNKKAFIKICSENGYEAEKQSDGEIIYAVRRLIRRPGLIVGFLAVLFVISYLRNIVIRFDIKNENEKIQTDIMNVLHEEGVSVGSYIPDIDLVVVERALKQRVEGISWAGITRKGNSLIIDVVENIPEPTGSFSRFPTNLIAKENATVEKVMLLDGQLKTVIGSGVRKGDIIISGTVETRKSSWNEGKETVETSVRYTRSMGIVEGSFERTVVFEQKFDDIIKKDTGNVYKQNYLHLFSADIPLFFKAKIGSFTTQSELSTASVFGYNLPFGIKSLTLKEYDYKPIHYTEQQALELAKKKIDRYEKNSLKDYTVKNKKISTKSDKNSVKIEVTYSLYGNICEEAAFFIKK